MNKNQDEAMVGMDAFRALAQQFGQDDIYTRIITEEILKALMGVKSEEEKADATVE